MATDPRAGKPADPSQLVNIPRLITSYYSLKPDPGEKTQRVAFGTSGHRGSSFESSFNEDHILAITQAIHEYRQQQGTTGPLFLAKDTPAPIVKQLSTAFSKALDLPSVRSRFEPIGEEIPAPDRRTPEYFSKFVSGEIARWSGPIKASGVTVE